MCSYTKEKNKNTIQR